MASQSRQQPSIFRKQYTVAIDTVPLPEQPEEFARSVVDQIIPVIDRIVKDAVTVAIGTWPIPEKLTKQQE